MIAQPSSTATTADLDRRAAQAGQLLADAAAGLEMLRKLSEKWEEQGRNAYAMGIDPATVNFWTPDHARGYYAAAYAQQLTLFAAAQVAA